MEPGPKGSKNRNQHSAGKERRQLFVVLGVAWAVICLALLLLAVVMDLRRFETGFQELARHTYHQLAARFRENEAVLEGFAAYIAGMGELDEQRANPYSAYITKRFPHIFMLEVAEAVNAGDVDQFLLRQRARGYPQFEIKNFDYSGRRVWQPPPEAERYYPLIFLYPLPEESRPVLGLDLGSHEKLMLPLQRAIASGSYQTSLPFKLVEGIDGFVMFMPVQGLNETTPLQHQLQPAHHRYIVLIVLLSEYLLSNQDITQEASVGILLYHNDKTSDDPQGWLFNKPLKNRSLLPKFEYEANLEDSRRGFVLRIEQYFGPESISKGLFLTVIAISLAGFLFIRLFILQRYSKDIERAREDARLEMLENNHTTIRIPSRELLLEWLKEGVAEAGSHSSIALLYLDLENFKQVNSWYGYRIGDLVLKTTARRIQKCLARDDLVVRLRGDEFLVLLTDYPSTTRLEDLLERLRKEIRSPITIGDRVIFVGVSIGVTRYPDESSTLEEALNTAEKSMYQDKMSRRNRD